MSATITELRFRDWQAFALENEAVRLVVVPALGGKIVSIQSRATGREWLWSNPHLAFREPRPGRPYIREYDTGGWDEIFPTVNPCVVPGTFWGESPITDHGELWCRCWRVRQCEVDSGGAAMFALAAEDEALSFEFRRVLQVSSRDARIIVCYTLVNKSANAMPYVWCAHPLIAIEPGMRINLPKGTYVTCLGGFGDNCPVVGEQHAWPHLATMSGKVVDFGAVPEPGDSDLGGVAAKLFTAPMPENWAAVRAPAGDEALCFSLATGQVSHVGLWLNYCGWSGAGTAPYFNIGIEPTTAPHDTLADAVARGGAALLAPAGQHTWSLSISLRNREDDPRFFE